MGTPLLHLRKLVKTDMLNWNMSVFISPMFYDTITIIIIIIIIIVVIIIIIIIIITIIIIANHAYGFYMKGASVLKEERLPINKKCSNFTWSLTCYLEQYLKKFLWIESLLSWVFSGEKRDFCHWKSEIFNLSLIN